MMMMMMMMMMTIKGGGGKMLKVASGEQTYFLPCLLHVAWCDQTWMGCKNKLPVAWWETMNT